VTRVEKPKPLMIRVPKLEMPGREEGQFGGCGQVGGGECTAVGDIADHSEQEEEVQFNVAEGFFDLVDFQMLVLDACLVSSQSLDYDFLLAEGQAFGCDRTVWEVNKHDDSPDEAESADDDELELPAW
jgi:hypothetical protein